MIILFFIVLSIEVFLSHQGGEESGACDSVQLLVLSGAPGVSINSSLDSDLGSRFVDAGCSESDCGG